MTWRPPGWAQPAAAEPWHPSHRLDAWQQYGLAPAGDGGGGFTVGLTRRCARCEMAVFVADELTPVGVQPCVGAPAGGRRP